MNNTPTPRTDANDLGWQFHEQYDYFDSLSDDPIQWVDFARILERELTAAREKLKAVTEQRDRLAEAIRNHKEKLPFAPPPCDKKLYEALAAVKGGIDEPPTLIHNGVGIADMYSRDEFENAMKRTQ